MKINKALTLMLRNLNEYQNSRQYLTFSTFNNIWFRVNVYKVEPLCEKPKHTAAAQISKVESIKTCKHIHN